MHPLDDITIYYDGTVIDDNGANSDFRLTVNYVCDFYHKMLRGYKPPKTGRICIQLDKQRKWDRPNYFGSICSTANTVDEEKYLNLSKLGKYKYILDIVHQSMEELIDIYKWDRDVFQKAYDAIHKMEFKFSLSYPPKKSRDKKTIGAVVIEKTEKVTTLNLQFTKDDKTKKVRLFENRNWFWYDITYEMSKHSKWLDNNTFGVYSKKTDKFGYYSLLDDVIVGKLDFKENEFVL
jgi:hypothetical protein